jgi:hypothetical protein
MPAPVIPGMQTPQPGSLSSPGASLSGGYNGALGSLNQSLKLLQGSDSSQLAQAQQNLSQNQGKTQQGLINSGLGNTTVAQTMQQAPLQTYNNQIMGINNSMNQAQSNVLGQGAQLQAQGGTQMANLMAALQQQQQAQVNQSTNRNMMTPHMTNGAGPFGF